MGLPAVLHHRPVSVIAIHGGDHPAAAGGDAVIPAVPGKACEFFFQRRKIPERALLVDIPAIEQRVHPDPFEAFRRASVKKSIQLVDMAVDIAVGNHADEMDRPAGQADFFQLLPGNAFKDPSGLDGLVDKFGPLGKHPARTQSIMADLGIAHVVIRGQANRLAVGF